MAQIHALISFGTILAAIIVARGPVSASSNCTCYNNHANPGIGDVGVTNYYISGYGGGTCYANYDPAASSYANPGFFNNTANGGGPTGTGYFLPDPNGNHLGHNGLGPYTYYHFSTVFTGVTNFNYYYNYIFDSGTVGSDCASYCGSGVDCYNCCITCCVAASGSNVDVPTHPFAADGVSSLPSGGD